MILCLFLSFFVHLIVLATLKCFNNRFKRIYDSLLSQCMGVIILGLVFASHILKTCQINNYTKKTFIFYSFPNINITKSIECYFSPAPTLLLFSGENFV